MRCRRVAGVMLALVGSLMVSERAAAGGAVRGVTPEATRFVEETARLSPTIAAQIRALEQTDVFAYVELRLLGSMPEGATKLTAAGGVFRYLRITINFRGHAVDRAMMLGHELQHALEISAAPEVRDEDSLRKLYRRIGTDRTARVKFETVEAQRVAAVIRGSSAGPKRPSAPRLVRPTRRGGPARNRPASRPRGAAATPTRTWPCRSA